MKRFSEPTRTWFEHAFAGPTEAQRQAWPAIQSGENVLVVAPTGSGKTLSAFLAAIDGLLGGSSAAGDVAMAPDAATENNPSGDEGGGMAKTRGGHRRESRQGADAHGVRVLYISPLKALGVDVARNLRMPLDGIAAQAEAQGLALPHIHIAIRSGDTTAQERRAIASHPPDILVTTPESLYLLLTSKARRILRTVETIIVDEVHAVAGTKRGAHLALSMERLELLTAKPPQRIGLSATVRPHEEAARFLGGSRPVSIVDPDARPQMSLRVVEPLEDMRDLNPSSGAGSSSRGGSSTSTAGGEMRASPPHISGVTPAMRRMAAAIGPNRTDGGVDIQKDPAFSTSPQASDDRTHSIWPAVERHVLDQILAHHTTLVFVNSRGLAERLTARLNDLYAQSELGRPTERSYAGALHYDAAIGSSGSLVPSHPAQDTIAMAHHGSVSKDRRKTIEEDLKHGRLRCVVATSSLELGIDMGSVDLVIQIAPPLSVSSGLQRVGRAEHQVGGVSHALFYPLTRQQIIGAAASIESMQTGDIEALGVLRNPLDILAQQTVAAAAMDDLRPDDWYATVRHAAPFADLARDMFDATLSMMSGAYNTEEFSAFRPALAWNHDDDIISARPGAQRLAVTSGGTIPDRGLYTVVLPENDGGRGPRRVGELDEEMVYESRVGDVITLGTSTWQIHEITRDRVIVTPAPGRTARLPFWHGEGNGRDARFGESQGRFIREISAGLSAQARSEVQSADAFDAGIPTDPVFDEETWQRLIRYGLDSNAVSNLARLLAEQRAATGSIPHDRSLVTERCQDEEGDWRVILHSPYGRRVHEPWAMAISNRLARRYGYDAQPYAADDGIVLRLPQENGDIPAHELFVFEPDELQRSVEAQVGDSVLFAARFRECAARSLFLPRSDPGKRVPLWQQRLRSSQLLAAARTRRNFPLLLETARECLQDVYDLPALHRLMEGIQAASIAIADTTTETPSPFAEHLLFGFVGSVMYQYDVPQAERNASLLAMDPEVLERLLGNTDMSGVLDAGAIQEVQEELERRSYWNVLATDDVTGRITRFAKTHGPFTADQTMAALGFDAPTVVHELDAMQSRGELISASFLEGMPGRQYLHREVFRRIRSRSLAKARKAITPVSGETYQAFLLDRQGVGPIGGARYEGVDGVMRVVEQLDGISLPIDVWESSVLPARVADYQPYMLDQLLLSGDVIWVAGTDGSMARNTSNTAKDGGPICLHPGDSVLLSGGSLGPQGGGTRHAGVRLRDDGISIDSPSSPTGDEDAAQGDPHDEGGDSGGTPLTMTACILRALDGAGAYHADQLAALSRGIWQQNALRVDPDTGEILPVTWSDTQFRDALWSLVWQGVVTNSSLMPLRSLGHRSRPTIHPSRRRARMRITLPPELSGLWSLVPSEAVRPEEVAVARVEALLDRYGVVASPLVDGESIIGGFSGLYPVLKHMEENGSLIRGMFVDGLGAAQFANTATIDALRSVEQGHHSQSSVALDVLDPANLIGGSIPWPTTVTLGNAEGVDVPTNAVKASEKGSSALKISVGAQRSRRSSPSSIKPSRRSDSLVVITAGKPVLFAAPRSRHLLVFSDDEDLVRQACTELAFTLQQRQRGSITFADANGEALNLGNPYTRILHIAGFVSTPQGMTLYR